ncbi:hypothetical protein B0O99DRAFT_740134 [Bisporella sp. PMI_857]|nr:hypothetical protein B0O99DRAFT_740134 [Bisporella sp. PMI_857]
MVNLKFLAVALFFTSQPLAFAAPDTNVIRSSAATWADAHLADLPKDYKSFSSHSLAYRKAIFHRLDAASRAALWNAHFTSYRIAHPNLTPEQHKVIDNATALFGTETPADDAAKEQLSKDAQAAFGDEAADVVATLGPIDVGDSPRNPLMKRKPLCICSTSSDFCDGDDQCRKGPTKCTQVEDECGLGWTYLCNGLCYR